MAEFDSGVPGEGGDKILDDFLFQVVGDDPSSVIEFIDRHPTHREALEDKRRAYARLALELENWARGRTGFDPQPSAPSSSPLADSTIPGFRILRELGRGGMGVVYHAEELALRRQVALKVIPAGSPNSQERFQREIEAIAKVKSPHIVTLYRHGAIDGLLYYAMELLDGETFAALIQRWKTTRSPERHRRAAEIVAGACTALGLLH